MLSIETVAVGGWRVPAVVFEAEDARLTISFLGVVGNSIPTSESGKAKLREWKASVAAAAKIARHGEPLNPRWFFSVSAGFSFHPPSHGSQHLDVENFLKPTFDALAAGLFCPSAQDPRAISRFDYDDSNFQYLFVHRLPDAATEQDEGAGIVVSIRKQAMEHHY